MPEPPDSIRPPRAAVRLLSCLLCDGERFEKEGDFEEAFRWELGRRGGRRARIWYWKQVLRAVPVFLDNLTIGSMAMFRNHLKVGWRILRRHKGYSFLNIFGLALGIACSVLILLWVRSELSTDRFHDGIEDIYLVRHHHQYGSEVIESDGSVPALGPALKAENPEVLVAARFNSGQREYALADGDKAFRERVQMADPEIFRLFTLPWIRGDVAQVFGDPSVIVLSQRAAGRIFGSQDPVGRTLVLDGRLPFRVVGVMADIPTASTIRFDVWIPLDVSRRLFRPNYPDTWFNLAFQTYVRLRPGASAAALNARIAGRVRQAVPETPVEPYLYPFGRVYLHAHGRATQIRTFALIALGILVIACINFVNLSTARAARRSREVGLRKVVGARRVQVMGQFLGESLIQTLLALLAGVGLTVLAMGPFRALTGKPLALADLAGADILAGILGVALFAGLLAGFYPAVALSSFRPAGALKSLDVRGPRGAAFRKVLVVFQFALSVLLITSTAVIVSQVRFMKTKSLGFEKEHLLYIPVEGRLTAQREAFKSEVLADPRVEAATLTSHSPIGIYSNGQDWDWEGRRPDVNPLVTYLSVDPGFLAAFQSTLAAGQFFRPGNASSGRDVVINETFARLIGRDRAVGAVLRGEGVALNVIGVVKDFHFTPLSEEIGPLILFHNVPQAPAYRYLFVRLKPGDVSRAVAALGQTARKFNPGFPLDVRFLDADYDLLYRGVEREMGVVRTFAFLAVAISCLGLFGLAAFTAEQKTREIGIRKILGASVPGIVLSLSGEYARWVAAANLIALPLSYVLMRNWLKDFAYRAPLEWTLFALAAALSLGLAQLTVIGQALRAARSNPARSLRYE